jgi:hypothetical protein
MLNLQICPNCGELYDTSDDCASDKCTARYAIEWLEQLAQAPVVDSDPDGEE